MRRNLYTFLIFNVFYLQANSAVLHCEEPEFMLCNNGRCVGSVFICDGENDCGDMSDEKNCTDFKFNSPIVQCANDEYQCKDSNCIPVEEFCDAKTDCPDASDEYDNCGKDRQCDDFRCKSGHCIKSGWVCDGVKDCLDGSDEVNCENKTLPTDKCNNENDRYLCTNKRCILLKTACDGRDDCGDGSDEDIIGCEKADQLCKKTATCGHICRKTPGGPKCACRSGYKLLNNRTCTDIDECEYYGTCDQKCINNVGSYMCACQAGYNLEDNKKTCKAEGGEAQMIFSVKSEIRGIYLDSLIYYPVTHNLQHAVAVSLDANHVYWSDIEDGDEAIIRSLEDGSQREVIVTAGLNAPEDIAVDWVTGNIYFSDSGYMHIGVCTNEGSYCTIILQQRRDKPRGLALLPSNGIIYWTEWGSKPCIMMAGMDGKNNTAFVTSNLEWPNGLAIDYANNRMYWVDAKLKVIESIRLDGSDRRTVLNGVAKQPFSLALFENKLYWSDWSSNTIKYCDKFTGKNVKILSRQNSTVYGMHIYHAVLKPKIRNPCNSHPCSGLCLLNRDNGYTCACTLDQELSSDHHTCRAIEKKEHLIIAAGNTFVDYHHEILGKPKMITSVIPKRVTAITYNSLTGDLLACDQLTDSIFHINTITGDIKNVISLESEILGGMDFDYIGNNLYLTDIEHRTIEVHSLNTSEKTIFYFVDQPYDIALVPEEGVMFVVFRVNDKYRIDKMKMNGISRRIQIAGDKVPLLGPKVSLCYDKNLKRIFWSDQGSGRIESATIEGRDTYLFRTGLSEPVSLAVLGKHIFWTQFKSNHLFWSDKSNTHQNQKRTRLNIAEQLDVLHLTAIHGTYVNDEHACRKNTGNCSHVCLVSSPHTHTACDFQTCACPPGMMLSKDNRTCIGQSACSVGKIKCGEHDICINLHQRCDGVQDCPNGEDETSHCDELHSCGDDEYKCNNGDCISSIKRCNSHYDCADRSDEDNCDKKECGNNEFQCREGSCISNFLVCNGANDCPDFSDEMSCSLHTCGVDNFMCDIRNCIPKTWECDGEDDCPDGSDEGEKCHQITCTSEMFTCRNRRCIDASLKCNGVDDCDDNSDEIYCSEEGKHNFINCSADEYKCYNTETCLPMRVRCNGIQECPKNDDERDCIRCNHEEYACDNKKCIPENWVCDMFDDCGDKSDERDCDGNHSRETDISILSNCKEFRCNNGVCLPFNKVCNGIMDCTDRSDESGTCSTSCAKDNPCKHVCNKTPAGPVCSCGRGYRLSADSSSCEDINECEQNICSQICHNTVGSFTCSCYDGYAPRNDKTSCKADGPQMKIITATQKDIRKLSPSLSMIEIVHQDVSLDITGIDINAREGTVYWSNDALGLISKIHLDSKEQKTVTGLGRPDALAVDWITDNVYLIDNDRPSSIKVCNLEQQKCAALIMIQGNNKGMAIAVDPKNGWLFWSETSWISYNSPTSIIFRSDTAGSNQTIIAHRNVGVVSGITIDYLRSRVYWADTFFRTIEVSNLDGSNRMVFLKTAIHQPLSINVYEDSLYWLMGTNGKLQKCKLHDDKACTTITIGVTNIDKFFTILHGSRQVLVRNTCENQKCEHMCVIQGNGFKCICENAYLVNSTQQCSQSLSTPIKFSSVNAYRATESTRQRGTIIGIIVTVITAVGILSVYCYYRRVKPLFSSKSFIGIDFQNLMYDRRNEVVTTLPPVKGLQPGEHEYINPVNNLLKNCEKDGEKVAEIVHHD